MPAVRPATIGVVYAIAAYGFWGVVPIFWKGLTHVPPLEVLAHRMVWGWLLFVALVALRRRMGAFRDALGDRTARRMAAVAGSLLAVNWLTFIYAVATARVLHASLGYFLNPIVSVVLGLVVLGERLRPAQWAAVAVSAIGVVQLAAQTDDVPWIALVLAFSFGLYGLARKMAAVEPLPGSMLEMGLLLPLPAAYLVLLWARGGASFGALGPTTDLMLLGTGLITALPLWWFANATRRLPLSTLGFVQYLAPTGQLLLAVLLFGEAFTALHLRSFACIWLGVAVFSLDSWRAARRLTPVAAPAG